MLLALKQFCLRLLLFKHINDLLEALESVMCDVIKIRLKRRIATRSGKGNQPLNIKTAVERPILKLGLPNFRWSFYFILLLVASLLFISIFYDVTHATFQRFNLNPAQPIDFSNMLEFSQVKESDILLIYHNTIIPDLFVLF